MFISSAKRLFNFLLCTGVAATLFLANSTVQCAQMSSSAILFYNSEYEPHYGQPISQCSLLLRRAAQQGSTAINIVPTHYWMNASDTARVKPADAKCYADGWAEAQRVHHYCHLWEWDNDCHAFDSHAVQRFTEGFTRCLQEARSLFRTVLISPHLDDGSNTCHWRNLLFFDPLQKDAYGFSYYDIMIAPIIKAVQAVYGGDAGKGKQLWFGMQGEMGATVFAYPRSYVTIANRIRKYYSGKASVKVGVLLNHAYTTGVINRLGAKPVHPPTKMAHLDGGWGPLLPFHKWPNHKHLRNNLHTIQNLLNDKVDIIGISNYAVAPATNVQPVHLESAIKKLDAELQVLGIKLKSWRSRPGKLFIMNEFGLGGGSSECGDVVSQSPAEAGRTPWLGITKTFNANLNPWASPQLREYAKAYYAAALNLLAAGGANYRVDAAFLWNMVSWDVQDIHPASRSSEGSYGVPEVAAAICAHNRRH
jgi:hypothetical protein